MWDTHTLDGRGCSTPVHSFRLESDVRTNSYRAQGAAQCIEDAALLGKLSSGIRGPRDMGRILRRFHEGRRERVGAIARRSLEIGRIWSLSEGPEQEERDRSFQEGQDGYDGAFPNPFSDTKLTGWLYGADILAEAIRP